MSQSPPVRSEAEIRRIMRANRWVLRLARHWLALVQMFLFFYAGGALLAPVLMQAGATGPANIIYTVYGPLCHQFSFRSFFLFGDQLVYPREVSGTDLGTFEEYAARDPHFDGLNLSVWSADLQLKARSFTGNKEMGYKTALCERDVAIYAMMFLAGLAFSRVRKRLRPAPILLDFVLGLGPIGIDGMSQLLSYPPFELWPVRETLPVYRVLTGALFGLMNVWLAFPYMEESMQETVDVIEAKLEAAQARLDEGWYSG